MTEKGKIDPQLHEVHHLWIEDEIVERKTCRENRQKVITHVFGWSIVSAITGIGYVFIKLLKGAFPSIF